MNLTARPGLIALTLLALPATAAEGGGTLGAYVEADENDGLGIAADLTVHATDRTSWYLLASYADVSSGPEAIGTRSLETGAWHDFGRLGLDVGFGIWGDPGLADARYLKASLDWHGEVWSVALLTQLRRTDFDPFQARGTVTLRDGRQVTVSARADCDTGDTGIGLRLAFASGSWDGYVRGMSHDYDATRCRFSSPGLDALARTRREVFRQFAPLVTAQLSSYATIRVGSENSLLKDSISLGAGYTPGRAGVGLDYSHHRDFFGGRGSDTLSGRVTFVVSSAMDLSFTLGATGRDAFDTVVFAGIGVRAKF